MKPMTENTPTQETDRHAWKAAAPSTKARFYEASQFQHGSSFQTTDGHTYDIIELSTKNGIHRETVRLDKDRRSVKERKRARRLARKS